MKRYHILVLEDDLEALSMLLHGLHNLNEELMADNQGSLLVTVYSTYEDVEKYVNNSLEDYDAILLDRDCGIGGSFHSLDIEEYGPEKVIAMSMVPPYNDEAQVRGVLYRHDKDFENLDEFVESVVGSLRSILDS